MSKVGRNDPCPCGSGRKFKKCCLGRQGAAAPAAPPMPDFSDLHPYTVVRMIEDPRSAGGDPRLLTDMQRGWKKDWTRSKVAAMSTKEIEKRLVAYGVRYSRDRFLAQAAKLGPTRSA